MGACNVKMVNIIQTPRNSTSPQDQKDIQMGVHEMGAKMWRSDVLELERSLANARYVESLCLSANKSSFIFGSDRSSRNANLRSLLVCSVKACLEHTIFIFWPQIFHEDFRMTSWLLQCSGWLKDDSEHSGSIKQAFWVHSTRRA